MQGLAAAAIGSFVTEFTGVAGVGEMFGAPRAVTLPLAAAALLAIVGLGAYRRVERAALVIGLFELAFFYVAWKARPDVAAIARDAVSLPVRNRDFALMAAGVIGATFNPWMIFYQQSATVDKGLSAADLPHARADTGVGAALTQALTGAVLIAVAASFAGRGASADLASIGDIAAVLAPALGLVAGKVVFGAGVLGASLVAAIVASLALAWGVGEMFGLSRTLERRPFAGRLVLRGLCRGGRGLGAPCLGDPGPRGAQRRGAGAQRRAGADRHRISGRIGRHGFAQAPGAVAPPPGADRGGRFRRLGGRAGGGDLGLRLARGGRGGSFRQARRGVALWREGNGGEEA